MKRLAQTAAIAAMLWVATQGVVSAVSFAEILFEKGKADLWSGGQAEAAKGAKYLAEHPDFVVTVMGHASTDEGTPEEVVALSRRRAEAVRDFMVNNGAPRDRIVVEAQGDSRPTVPHAATEGERKLNRCVNFRWNTSSDLAVGTQDSGWPVKLFYKDYAKDPGLEEYKADSYVVSYIEPTATPIQDTLYLLIQSHFHPQFQQGDPELQRIVAKDKPISRFRLTNVSLDNGTAILTFDDPDHYSSGGSAGNAIRVDQVRKTVLQFKGVRDVRIEPVDVFQP